MRRLRSRFTREPTRQVPSVVFDSVSAEALTANQSAPTSIAVRQQPEQEMEAPMGMFPVSGQGAPMTRRMSLPAPRGFDGAHGTEPGDDAGEHQALRNSVSQSSPAGEAAWRTKRGMSASRCDAERLRGGPAVAAHDGGGMEPGDAIHQVGAQQRGGDLAAAFDQQARDAALGQRFQRRA